jgi:mannosyl-oligosaccharide alpha-1,2-mannosidase
MAPRRPTQLFAVLCIAALGWSFWQRKIAGAVDWDERRGEVKDAFLQSWTAYSEYAWGRYFIQCAPLICVLTAMLRQ